MPEPQPRGAAAPEVQAQLHEIAQLLRTAYHLRPESQAALAELADDLGNVHGQGAPPSAESETLLRHAHQLVEALHQEEDSGLVAAARQKLEEAVATVEGRAPYAVAFARRLLDVLVSLGI